jgi:hypothetical protein
MDMYGYGSGISGYPTLEELMRMQQQQGQQGPVIGGGGGLI